MTRPDSPHDAPQNLMLPFGPLADEAGRGVVLSEEHADAVLGYCREMGARFGAPGYLRYLFGLPVNEALLAGYQITQRALRETTPHACAQEIARTALEILPDPGRGHAGHRGHAGRAGEAPGVLDLFAGIGQMAYSYAKAGCRVQATDNDPTTVGVATHNMALAGLSASVGYRVADGPATLAAAVEAGQEFSVVHLDPPWRGTYKYDLAQPFTLEALAVDVPELVRLGLEHARLVVLNLPHNALPSQLSELAAKAGCNVLIERLFISDFPASFSQAPAYFFGRSPAGPAKAAGPAKTVAPAQERRQNLTLDGQRAATPA
jgi:predicted RNA methylase